MGVRVSRMYCWLVWFGRALLYDLSLVQHDDEVAVGDGAQPVRHREGGALLRGAP